MNEAPKEIWLDSDMTAWVHYSEDDTLYIRADIVDELVAALKEGMDFNEAYWKLINFSPSDTGLIKELTDKARAALAKLEEEQ